MFRSRQSAQVRPYPGKITLFRPKQEKTFVLGPDRVVNSAREFVYHDNGWGQHAEEIEIHEVPGDHEVVMRSATERLTFAHSVTTRQVFADGAIRAARWVVGKPEGRYDMSNVLFGE